MAKESPDPFSEESIRKIAEAIGATPEQFNMAFGEIKACEVAINRARSLIESEDPVILNQLREIIAYACDMIEYIGEEFDPTLLKSILSFVGGVAESHSNKWAKYTQEEAPSVNRSVAVALRPDDREDT